MGNGEQHLQVQVRKQVRGHGLPNFNQDKQGLYMCACASWGPDPSLFFHFFLFGEIGSKAASESLSAVSPHKYHKSGCCCIFTAESPRKKKTDG